MDPTLTSPFSAAVMNTSGTSVTPPGGIGFVPMAPGVSGLGEASAAISYTLAIAGAAGIGAGVGYAAARTTRGAIIGAALQAGLAGVLTAFVSKGSVGTGGRIAYGLGGLLGLAFAGHTITRR